ncbi:2-hydroxychromene-2-carboxylate isomerase [Piscinibacter koreensis]|uniref:2-hydroxychromene-2-carboxylate isomerase n=1 Tax=Piscinibacter koreensis TaxID=2742824 RepID=A0A7Y6NNM4_9BURK|nr:2-hydroxychromene-2-carboxylate isomerase [Schlegelella koreensis]NUZ06520.1 2-hydroxychromene-2-carboxylate isomerase [Schlegelella koreensis]
MNRIDFWFDPVSPYAYLAFERLPEALVGLSYEVRYRPLVFGALLKHFGQKGPAEIEPKRQWTFRHVHWLAARDEVELQTPAVHPFNSLALSRLAWACAKEGATPNRHVCEMILRHAWRGGGSDAADPQRVEALTERLAPPVDPGGEAAKQRLRDSTEAALAAGVFGVPTLGVAGKLFWGFDALEMVAGCLRGDPWFTGGDWEREGAPRPGVRRAGS